LFAEKIVSIKAVNKKTTLKKECVLTRNFYFKANIPYPYGFYCFQKIFVSREQLSCSRERIKTDKNGTFFNRCGSVQRYMLEWSGYCAPERNGTIH